LDFSRTDPVVRPTATVSPLVVSILNTSATRIAVSSAGSGTRAGRYSIRAFRAEAAGAARVPGVRRLFAVVVIVDLASRFNGAYVTILLIGAPVFYELTRDIDVVGVRE
jgi:hypothetical protein